MARTGIESTLMLWIQSLYKLFTLVWENMEANPFPLVQESRLTTSESSAHLKTFDLCLFEHWTGGTEFPPAAWYWEDQCWLECRARELAYLTFFFSNIPPTETFPRRHVKSCLQMPTWLKPVLFYTLTLAVCVLAVSLLSPPLLLTQASAVICWSYYSCFFHRAPWLCQGFLVNVAVTTLQ